MHIAAASPIAVQAEDLPQDVLIVSARSIWLKRRSPKAENILEKMVEGKMRKFYEEVVLLQQKYVKDPDNPFRIT